MARRMDRSVKWIIVTGGVLSGLGKGVAAVSIGNLLAHRYTVVPMKCDGYLNVDPGTMNPVEHGEVFVLDDGGEVDMDFGHYERFLGTACKREWNLTMGKVFERIREKERRGDYLGKTVQQIPHVTNLIKDWWKETAKKEQADVMLIEVGGTVGDIENELYIEAARQLKRDVGEENIMYVHLTFVPKPIHVNEHKSKPTQQSVTLLRQRGIFPDLILARSHDHIPDRLREKIATFCDIPVERVISAHDVPNVYCIPLEFAEQGVADVLAEELGLAASVQRGWQDAVTRLEKEHEHTARIAIAGKYTALEDSYASVVEALKHAAAKNGVNLDLRWVETSDGDIAAQLKDMHGVIVPGGFGGRGTEGKIAVAQHCREHDLPYLGLCYGLQMAVIEYARNVCGLAEANTTEVAPTKMPVVDILPEQKGVTEKGGTMRLGAYPAVLAPQSVVAGLYGSDEVSERHRHRYEINPEYHKALEEHGLRLSGVSPDGTLVEFIELPEHPFFVATQAHPELKSTLLKPAPLFDGLIKACRPG